MINKALQWWDEFWFKDVSPYPLAAFRILFGTYLLFYLGSLAPKMELNFSNHGVYVPYIIPDIAPGPFGAAVLYYSTLGLIIALIVGYKTRFVTPLVLVLYIYHYLLSFAVSNHSYDRMTICLLFILCFAEIDRVWSISNKNTPKNVLILGWAQRFMCVFLCIIYFGMGVYKMTIPDWHTGLMLEMNMHGSCATRLSFGIIGLGLPAWVFTGATWATIGFEILLALTLFIRPLQRVVFTLGIIFHVFIYLTLNITEFLFMPMLYVLFVDGDRVRQIGNKISSIVKSLT